MVGERSEEAHSWADRCALSTEVGVILPREQGDTAGLSPTEPPSASIGPDEIICSEVLLQGHLVNP